MHLTRFLPVSLVPALILCSAASVLGAETTSAPAAIPIDTGATAWLLTSTALVLLMVPGLAMFYGGLVRTKNVLGTMMHSFVAMCLIGVLWVICGYNMFFGPNVLGGWFGWDSSLLFLKGIDEKIMKDYGVPEYVFAMFQGKFAIITPALIAGALAERVKFRGYCIFIAVWGLLVYNPLAHWVWAPDGFLFNMGAKGAIDFAGGTVVHISSGITGLVVCLYLGKRKGYPSATMRPNNMVMVLMGAGLLWVGWFGFNAGSSVASGLLTAQALTATQAAAAAGALSWMLIEAFHTGKPSALGFASGMLAGLVAVTPAAGVVLPSGAMALAVIASFCCYGAIMMKNKLGYDDSLDAFGVHGVGGTVGAVCLSFFIRESWMADAATKVAGWNAMNQLGVQLKAVGCAIGYAAVVGFILAVLVDKIFGLRASSEEETIGLDQAFHGEHGYHMLASEAS
jgi:Amt family ammonium transporter